MSNSNGKKAPFQPALSMEEPEITVAPATLSGEASENFHGEVQAQAILVEPSNKYDPSKQQGTTAAIPPFQDALNDNLPTANAKPVRHNKYGKRPIAPQTGEELLQRMKVHRKAATVHSGLWGGLLGLILLGPIGAIGIGAGSAILTKKSLKRKEKVLRQRLEGRLHDPVFLM